MNPNSAGMGVNIPALPTYTNPGPVVQPKPYVGPGSFTSPGGPAGMPNPNSVPGVQSASQVVGSGMAADQQLPDFLRITTNPVSQQAMQQYQDAYYKQYLNPAIQQSLANQYGAAGGGNSTFANAIAGQAMANGATDWALAGQQYATNALNNQLAQRASFFGNEGQLAQGQNAADVARGEFTANLGTQQAGMLNDFNLQRAGMQNNWNMGASGAQNAYNLELAQLMNSGNLARAQMQNSFNQSNFGNAMDIYGAQRQNVQGIGQNIAGMAGAGAALAGGIWNSLYGPGARSNNQSGGMYQGGSYGMYGPGGGIP